MKHPNITAYEGVESLSRFNDKSFQEYCDQKLQSCDKHINFIINQCLKDKKKLKVCEIGSGSGKLLFRLEKEGILEYGVGYELSKSRVEFSTKFGEYCKSKNVIIKNMDFMEDSINENFDLVIGIDVVINLIGAISKELDTELLEKSKNILNPNGFIVLEYMTCEKELNFIEESESHIFRTWKEFEESDPFRFGLDEISMHFGNVNWRKLFVSRDGSISEFTNILKPYSTQNITSLFKKNNLETMIFNNWSEGDDTLGQELIALGKIISPVN